MKCKYEHIKFTEQNTHEYKDKNEDSALLSIGTFDDDSKVIFALVSDGMGGQKQGEFASGKTKDHMREWFSSKCKACITSSDIPAALVESWDDAISGVNRQINEAFEDNAPGCTLSMILIYQGKYYAANIGDSRVYQFTGGRLYQITRDHSWAQMQLDKGTSPEDIEKDPRKNKITRCIGCGIKDCKPDYFEGEYADGDIFIVCSDGLRHRISAEEITNTLRETTKLSEKIIALKDLARMRGEEDDITAVLIKTEIENGKTEAIARTVVL